MSLINQVLKNIDKRESKTSQLLTADENIKPVFRKKIIALEQKLIRKFFLVLVVAGAIIYGTKNLSTHVDIDQKTSAANQTDKSSSGKLDMSQNENSNFRYPIHASSLTSGFQEKDNYKKQDENIKDTSRDYISKTENEIKVKKIETPEQRARNLYEKAQSLIREGNIESGRMALVSAIASDPLFQSARLLLARVLIERGSLSEAEDILQSGLKISNDKHDLLILIAHIKMRSNDIDGAIEFLKREQDGVHTNPEVHAFLGAALQQKGLHEEAIKHYSDALRLNPSRAQWLVALAVSLQAQNRIPLAIEAYQRALVTGALPERLSEFALKRLNELNGERK